MKRLFAIFGVLAVTSAGVTAAPVAAGEVGTIRLAEADSFSGEDLVQLIAYKQAEQRGVTIELSAFKSDSILFQAVLNGQIDMGVGDSYEPIASLKAPIVNVYQIRKLAYVPVVDKAAYPTWSALNGQPFAVHSRGSGTEALAKIMEKKNGIHFSQITYLPGSEVRIVAMQRGTIKATYLDLETSKILLDSDPKRFAALPSGAQEASDSTLYVSGAFLKKNPKAVQILLEELLKSARATAADPSWPARRREELGLLPELSPKDVAEITPYFERANALGIFPTDGGGRRAAKADVEFLGEAGKLDATLDPDAFWDYGPLDTALAVSK